MSEAIARAKMPLQGHCGRYCEALGVVSIHPEINEAVFGQRQNQRSNAASHGAENAAVTEGW